MAHYTETEWSNNEAPALNEDNLQKIENGISAGIGYETAAEVRALGTPTSIKSLWLNGIWFLWDATSEEADNGGTVILPTSHAGAGRWVAQSAETGGAGYETADAVRELGTPSFNSLNLDDSTWFWDAASTSAEDGVNGGAGTVILPTGHSGAGRWVRYTREKHFDLAMLGTGQAALETGILRGSVTRSNDVADDVDTYIELKNSMYGLNVTGGNTEVLRYHPNVDDVVIEECDIDVDWGIAIHHNTPANNVHLRFNKISSEAGYAYLSNNAAQNCSGQFLLGNNIYSGAADAVELNNASGNSANDVKVIGNTLETGLDATSQSSGFAVGVAGTTNYIVALNHVAMSRQEAFHVEDDQTGGIFIGNTATTQADGMVCLPRKAADGDSDPIIFSANHLTSTVDWRTEGTELSGMLDVYDSHGSPDYNIYTGNYTKGFARGLKLGRGSTVIADNNVSEEPSSAISMFQSTRVFGSNHIKGACNYGARVYGGGFIDRITFDSVPENTLFQWGDTANQCGTILKSFNMRPLVSHTGSGVEIIGSVPVPLTSSTRLIGKATILMAGTPYGSVMFDSIKWDGSALTIGDSVDDYYGAFSGMTFIEDGGVLSMRCYSEEVFTNRTIIIDFDGYFYQNG